MIYKLQRKFILISTVSVLSVIALVFVMILLLNVNSMNRNLDILADKVSDGGGRFPLPDQGNRKPGSLPHEGDRDFGFITPETPYATRHFTVFFDEAGEVARINTEAIFSITEEDAIEYAKRAIAASDGRGWIGSYRYKVFSTDKGSGAAFIDGSLSRSSLLQSLTIAGAVLLGCGALVLLLIILLSKRMVKPIAESYEKQKQFITDANHELKTPLTLILANLDIAESELGENEWLSDIRTEGHRMTELVNQLVALSRMDEDGGELGCTEIPLSETVADAVSEFEPSSKSGGKSLITEIAPSVYYKGNEALIRRLLSVLLDNAVKYCDDGGEIYLKLEKHHRISLSVENTYAAVGETELGKLFDRFYRADKARTYAGGYGIGLSIAKAIVERHGGEISAYKKDAVTIGFKVTL